MKTRIFPVLICARQQRSGDSICPEHIKSPEICILYPPILFQVDDPIMNDLFMS